MSVCHMGEILRGPSSTNWACWTSVYGVTNSVYLLLVYHIEYTNMDCINTILTWFAYAWASNKHKWMYKLPEVPSVISKTQT